MIWGKSSSERRNSERGMSLLLCFLLSHGGAEAVNKRGQCKGKAREESKLEERRINAYLVLLAEVLRAERFEMDV